MARKLIDRYSDYDVVSVAPTIFNYATDSNEVIDNAASGSASFKVYDPSKDEVISVAEAIGQTILSVTNAGEFDVDDAVEVTQNDESLISSTVSAVDSTLGTVTIDDALTVAAAVGNRIRVIFGAEISMSEYGTANLNTRNWGYQGILPRTNSAHDDTRAKDGLEVDIEVSVSNATRTAVDTICALIKENDCD